MNSQDRIQIGELWITVAAMYGKEILRPALKLMLDAIGDLPVEPVIKAFEGWVKTSKAKTYPLPADIRDLVTPSVDDRNIALDLAKRISGAISRRGWTWPSNFHYEGFASFEEAVIAELGELAWVVICRRGGWQKIHDEYFEVDTGIFTAQLRDHIESVIKMAKAGILDTPPALPQPQNAELPRLEGLTPIGQIGEGLLLKLKKNDEG
jgi:hypothetical protein